MNKIVFRGFFIELFIVSFMNCGMWHPDGFMPVHAVVSNNIMFLFFRGSFIEVYSSMAGTFKACHAMAGASAALRRS